MGRRAIRVGDLADPEALDAKIERLLAHHNALRKGLDLPEVDVAGLKAALLEVAPKVLLYAGQPAWRTLDGSTARASACCSRARRAPCWTWTTAPIPM